MELYGRVNSVKDLLSLFPNAVYTTVRTVMLGVSAVGILFPDEHTKRLGTTRDSLLTLLRQYSKEWVGDERITVINEQSNLFFVIERIDVERFNQLRNFGCKVVSVKHERPTPGIKSTEWVRQRQALFPTKNDAEVEETLLINQKGEITEGASSNVFACYEDERTWYTAPDSLILPGTMRQAMIEAMVMLGITLKFEAPVMERIKSAFICSTSRVILPIADFDERQLCIIASLAERIFQTLNENVLPKYALRI